MKPATLRLIAGPDGVGRTTFAFRQIRRLSGETSFVNLDEIARGLVPLAPETEALRASRVALAMIRDLIAGNGHGRRSFSLETTLAGRTHLRTMADARAAGFRVNLLYFCVRSEEVALARIARRFAEGGHDVPEADARRRFARSVANFPLYAAASDLWQVFDANPLPPKIVAEGEAGRRFSSATAPACRRRWRSASRLSPDSAWVASCPTLRRDMACRRMICDASGRGVQRIPAPPARIAAKNGHRDFEHVPIAVSWRAVRFEVRTARDQIERDGAAHAIVDQLR